MLNAYVKTRPTDSNFACLLLFCFAQLALRYLLALKFSFLLHPNENTEDCNKFPQPSNLDGDDRYDAAWNELPDICTFL